MENYGLITIVTSLAAILSIISDFGTQLIGIKETSRARDKIRESNVILHLFSIRIAMGLIVSVFFLIVVNLGRFLNENQSLFLLSIPIMLANTINTSWYFQGKENLALYTLINFTFKSITLCLIILLINQPNDIIKVPIINTLGIFLANIISLAYLKKKYKLILVPINVKVIKVFLRKCTPLFTSSVITTSYNQLIPILIGSYISPLAAGNFGVADKIIKLANNIFTPVSQLFLPILNGNRHNSEQEKFESIKKLLLLSIIGMLILSFIGYFTSDMILSYFVNAEEKLNILSILEILWILPVVIAISRVLSQNFMLTFNLQHQLPKVYFLGIILMMPALCYSLLSQSIQLLAWSIVGVETAIMINLWRITVRYQKRK